MLKKGLLLTLFIFLFSCTSIQRPNNYGAKTTLNRFSKIWIEENRENLPKNYILIASPVSEKGFITDKLINFAKTIKYGDEAAIDSEKVEILIRDIPANNDTAYISFNSRTLITAIKKLSETNPDSLKNRYFGFKTTFNTYPVTEEEVKELADKFKFFYIVEFN